MLDKFKTFLTKRTKLFSLVVAGIAVSWVMFSILPSLQSIQAQNPIDWFIQQDAPVPAGEIQKREGGDANVQPQSDIETQAGNEASVIVNLGEGKASIIRTASFNPATVTGLEALQASGLNIVTTTTSFGPALCAIEGVGCPATDCFCQCSGGSECVFWSYNFWNGSAWESYGTGPGGSTISNGNIEGYTWGGTLPEPEPLIGGQKALDWLMTQQNSDGSYDGFSGPSVGSTLEVMLAAGSNRIDADTWRLSPSDDSLLDYLKADDDTNGKSNGEDYADIGPSAAGKLALSLAAVGRDPATFFTGFNLVEKIEGYYDPAVGLYVSDGGSDSNWDQALAILGLRAAQEFDVTPTASDLQAQATIQANAVQNLKERNLTNGGWSFAGSGSTDTADTNSTALVIQALLAGEVPLNDPAIEAALDYLENAQNSDGGFAYIPPDDSEANSTGYVSQGLIATLQDLNSSPWNRDNTPIEFILSLQQSDGSIYYQSDNPGFSLLLSTTQATPPLFNQAFPMNVNLSPVFAPEQDQLYFPLIFKNGSSS